MASASADYDPGQAAAAGLGWVDKNHPLYGTKGFVGYDESAAGGAALFEQPPTIIEIVRNRAVAFILVP